MKYGHLLPLLALVSLVSVPVSAQKEKRADISGFSFVTGPKGDRPQLPGLNAILMLTDEQKEKLVLARQETLGSEPVVAAGRKVKGDPNASEADRLAARKLSEESQGRYEKRVKEILTPAQSELIQRLQVLYGQSREGVSAEFGPKLVGAKGNQSETLKLRQESRDALTADFARRVNEILTVEQRAAFDRAAAEEKQRAAAKPKSKG